MSTPTAKTERFSTSIQATADREEKREKLTENDCRVIIWSHALKQSARLSRELEREATRQDKTREGEVIKS